MSNYLSRLYPKNHMSLLMNVFMIVTFFFLEACSPTPRRTLSAEERNTDLKWLITKIEENYAPLYYKQKVHNFNYNEIKENFLNRAKEDQTNEEFYLLLKEFIAVFKDGHMSGQFNNSTLPGRSQVAFLGIRGVRVGDNFLVKSFFPTFDSDASYPIKVGDMITEFNGEPLKDAVDNLLTKYRDVGNKNANYTILMSSLFARSSDSFPIPQYGDFATLTVKRGSRTFETTVPWVIQDRGQFSKEQENATKAYAHQLGVNFDRIEAQLRPMLDLAMAHPFVTQGNVEKIFAILEKGGIDALNSQFFGVVKNFSADDTFETHIINDVEQVLLVNKRMKNVIDKIAGNNQAESDDPLASLKKARYVPKTYFPLTFTKVFHSYVTNVDVEDVGRQLVGYIRIPSFSIPVSEKDALKEMTMILTAFHNYGERGVDRIVVDLISNGGGSLSLGVKLAQIMAMQEIQSSKLRLRLNDNWLDNLEAASRSLTGRNNAIRSISESIYQQNLRAFENSEFLGPEFNTNDLYPFSINKAEKLVAKDYQPKYLLLINETCASMCDIFTAIFKDNNIGATMGSQTMGAGGNVVSHNNAPNSGLTVRLTESLIASPNGQYLENFGVKADFEVDTTLSANSKYESVISAAFKKILSEEFNQQFIKDEDEEDNEDSVKPKSTQKIAATTALKKITRDLLKERLNEILDQ